MEEFRYDGIWGRYYSGDKGTFILLHGLLSSSSEFFDYPEKIALRGYGVIIFDFSGHGKSEGIAGFESMQKNIDDLKKVLKYFKGKISNPIILLGHSLGAATVIFALSERLADIGIAIAPPASIYSELKTGEKIILPILYRFGRVYEQLTKKRFYIKYRANYDTIYTKKETIEMAKKSGFLGDKIWLGSYPYLTEIDTISVAKKVHQPCLIVTPSNDKLVKPKNQREVYENISGEKGYYIANGYNHSVMGEDNGEIIELIFQFVSKYGHKKL